LAHVSKYTRGAVTHLFRHYERAKDSTTGEYIKFGNQEINKSKSHLNYNLAPTANKSQGELLKERCSQVKCLNRKDVNVMCSWVLTLPQEIDKTDEARFFQIAYNFLEDRYKKENIISAYVHLDEAQPHMHFAFVPVVKDKKKGHYKVSAKELISKMELKTFHTDLQAHMERHFDKEVLILNGATKNGNKSVYELKIATLQEQETETEKQLAQKDQELIEVLKKIAEATKTNKKIMDIDHKDVKENKNTFGKVKSVSMSLETFQSYDIAIKQSKENKLKLNWATDENKKMKAERDYYKSKLDEVSKNFTDFRNKFNKVRDIAIENKETIDDTNTILKRNPELYKLYKKERQDFMKERELEELKERDFDEHIR
jgi:hypothetical protein